MKNKKFLNTLFIIFFLSIVNSTFADEIIFETPEIQSFENGKIITADQGGKALINKSSEIIADSFKYNKETKIKIPEETINLLKVQRDSVMEKLNFSNNTYSAKSSFPLSNTLNSFDLLWRMCESYELWCKEVDKKDLIKLNITAEN